MIVVDASVLAGALVDDGAVGESAREQLRGEFLAAPALIDLEVTFIMRRASLSGRLPERRALQAFNELLALPLRRARHAALLPRIWALRENVSAYDAAYVALAEALGAPLLTADRRLARAPGVTCDVVVVE